MELIGRFFPCSVPEIELSLTIRHYLAVLKVVPFLR